MDALSAYRVAMTGVRPLGAPAAGAEPLGKVIPQSELEKLSSSVLRTDGAAIPNLSPAVGAGAGASFEGMFGSFAGMVNEVSNKQAEAGDAMRSVMAGEGMPLHRAMIAVEEASVSFQLMVEVRNKLLESYQELMRMQV